MINRANSDGTAISLLFIDLDRFKEVNDTLGHEAGDALLEKVAAQLRSTLRGGDFVARLGGDEFAFLLCGDIANGRDRAMRVSQRILDKLEIRVPCTEGVIQVGCTIGVAVYPGGRGQFRPADGRGRPADVCRQKERPQPDGHGRRTASRKRSSL